jgi:hypothetical protein
MRSRCARFSRPRGVSFFGASLLGVLFPGLLFLGVSPLEASLLEVSFRKVSFTRLVGGCCIINCHAAIPAMIVAVRAAAPAVPSLLRTSRSPAIIVVLHSVSVRSRSRLAATCIGCSAS